MTNSAKTTKRLALVFILVVGTALTSFAQRDMRYISKPAEGMMEMLGPNGKYGYITQEEYNKPPRYITTNVDGELKRELIPYIFVIEPQFDAALSFYGGAAIVSINDKWGLIDKKGNIVCPIIYENIRYLYQRLVAVYEKRGSGRTDHKIKIFDKITRKLDSTIYSDIDYISNAHLRVTIGNKQSIIDTTGQQIIPPIYTNIEPFEKEIYKVYTQSGWGIIDTVGKVIVEPKYQHIEHFDADGLAAVQLDDKWGYVNRKWELVIRPKWDDARQFSGGLAAIYINDKWGYINNKGIVVIKPQFDIADEFYNGYAAVSRQTIQKSPKYGVIDGTGKVIIKPQYQEIQPYDGGGLFVVQLNEKWGYVDINNRVVIAIKYDKAESFGYSQRATVRLGYQEYYINRRGKITGELQNAFDY